MNTYNHIKLLAVFFATATTISCTKLDQNLQSSLTSKQTADALGAAFVLQNAYNDVGLPYSDLGNIFALEEVTSDECLVPTRSGDWDDNGKWRALHQHNWNTDGVDIILAQFNTLNKIQFDATNVMLPDFKATTEQAAEARFIRALSLYQLLDLYGQFPFRNPGDNLLKAPIVMRGDSAINFIISELTTILPQVADNPVTQANPDAVRLLLMKCYLNKGAFLHRSAPTFDDADMQQVITLGNTILGNGKYSYSKNYFDNFSPTNDTSKEIIFASPNTSGVSTNNTGIHNRWWATLHYNQYQSKLGSQGGWNGFSTVAEFYNSFGVNSPATHTPTDTLLDPRIGGRIYKGATEISGVRPGLMIGQQYNEKGEKYLDRKNNLLIFDPTISPDLKETGPNLELTGIRIAKYPPDYSNGGSNYSTAGNWCVIFRTADVLLMVAEAKMRSAAADNAGALALVNQLRAKRGTTPLVSMTLVNTGNVYDPGTLLAERGRELYWESVRRTDLIRFGVFKNAWAYKTASTDKYLVFPIPTQALAANPNLIQNPGYN
ncbi:RagB/SusD family nutrient uptake outer membrane protein [Flavitalea flava]